MSHLSEDRFVEMGMSPETPLSSGERSHLAVCPPCRQRVQREQRLTSLLVALPQPQVPSSLFAAATHSFAAAHARKQLRHLLGILAGLVIVGPWLGVPMVYFLVVSAPASIHHGVLIMEEAAIVLQALLVVAIKLPILPLMLAAAMCAAAMLTTLFLSRVAAHAGATNQSVVSVNQSGAW